MAIQTKFGSFQQRSGTGTQAVTGVGFEPTGLIVWGNYVGSTGTNAGALTWRMGLSDGTHQVCYASNSGNFLNAAEASFSGGSQSKCFMAVSTEAGPFFTSYVIVTGTVTFAADGFIANFDLNYGGLGTGATWYYLALGGTITTTVGVLSTHGTGTATVSGLTFAPTALLGWRAADQADFAGIGVAAGNLGFATPCEPAQIALAGYLPDSVNPSADVSAQLNGVWFASVNAAGTVTTTTTVTAYTADGFSLSFVGASVEAQYYMAIGGCAANVGFFTQPVSTGSQTVPLQTAGPRAVLIVGRNKVTAAAGTPDYLVTVGGTDGTTQGSVWTGTLAGQSPPFKVNSAINTTHAISAYTPTGAFASSLNSAGAVTLSTSQFAVNWTTVDGVAREWFYLALADDFGTGPCGTGGTSATYTIRRVRIFTLPSEADQRLLFLHRLETLVQAGVGLTTGQGSDPTFTVRISRDGGMTYGTAYVLSPGALGDYEHRAVLTALGQYRNATVEIAMSDPVLWALLDCYVDLEKGTN